MSTSGHPRLKRGPALGWCFCASIEPCVCFGRDRASLWTRGKQFGRQNAEVSGWTGHRAKAQHHLQFFEIIKTNEREGEREKAFQIAHILEPKWSNLFEVVLLKASCTVKLCLFSVMSCVQLDVVCPAWCRMSSVMSYVQRDVVSDSRTLHLDQIWT